MRLVRFLLASAPLAVLFAQQPLAIGPDRGAGTDPGVAKYFHWYDASPSGGCSKGADGFCVGHQPQGDAFYFTAWMPNASGLPVPTGLPIVGTINDFSLGSICSGNLGILQLDTWSWAIPSASHITKVNCMPSFGVSPADSNSPTGWHGHLTSPDSVGNAGTWKSREPFSMSGILYLPVERQISAGGPSVHDATFIMSPDSGKHWCNAYTLFKGGSPGTCNATSPWQSDGDAPKCDALSSSTPCKNAAYLDPVHSSIMWKALPLGTENWAWVNYGFQDGKNPPAGVNDGCDPTAYTCFMMLAGGGQLARVPNAANILDISAWSYYTCPTLTQNYRCSGTDPANWTTNFAGATPLLYTVWTGHSFNAMNFINGYQIFYVKEFGSYIMFGQTNKMVWAPQVTGPWNETFCPGNAAEGSFVAANPALGYSVISTNPPHVQITTVANSYAGGQGSPAFAMWDFVLGRQTQGEAFQYGERFFGWNSGAKLQFSSGNIAGSLPRKGLVWAFDFLEAWTNNYPYFIDRANNDVVVSACNAGTYVAPLLCGSVNTGRGTGLNAFGIQTSNPGYSGHFNIFPASSTGFTTPAPAPSAMLGNGSYSVVGVYRYEGVTNFRTGGIWSAGTGSGSSNTAVSLGQLAGNLILDWNGFNSPRYHFITKFTFPNFSNWYFVAVTVDAQTGVCGSNCTPIAKVWVGGAVTPGALMDVNAGVPFTAMNGATTKTPNVQPGPFVVGIAPTGTSADSSLMSYAAMMVYNRPLRAPEVQMMYRSIKAKMAERGVTLQ